MVVVSHILFVDESGNAQRGASVTSLWTSVGLAAPFEKVREIDSRVAALRVANFRTRVKEANGSAVPHELRQGRTPADLASDLAGLLDQFGTHCWITAVQRADPPNTNPAERGSITKKAARQLLLERVNGFLNLGRYEPANWLIVWDVSDVQELNDFSASVAQFKNDWLAQNRNERLFPAVLGGLSHDFGGLQAADLLSNFALHFRGRELGFQDANLAKADAFNTHLMKRLQRTAAGTVVGCGWKTL